MIPVGKIEDVFDVGSSKRVFKSEWTTKGVPFYRAREVVKLAKEGQVDNELYISEEMFEEYSEKYGVPKTGDLLVTGVGTLGICYQVKDHDRFYFKDGNIIWLKNKGNVDSRYIEYCYKSPFVRRQIESTADAAVVGTYTITNARETKIPLPPLDQQKKIAAILDAADKYRQKTKDLIAKYDELTQSLFLDMFGDPVINPMGWEYKKLSELVSKLGDGLHGTPQYSENGEYYFVNGNNLQQGKIFISEKTKKVSEEEFLKHKKELNSNTVLVSINGTIGKVAFYNDEPIMLGKSACYFNLIEGVICKTYLYYVIYSPYFLRYAGNQATGSTIKNVSLKSMRNFPIPYPSIDLQNQFAERVKGIEAQKAQAQESLAKAEDLFNSLLQKAFKGELT